MRNVALATAAAILLGFSGTAIAQSGSSTPENSASSSKEADKMKSGDKAGSTPNSSIPGANPAGDGNKTQDSRTTKDRDR